MPGPNQMAGVRNGEPCPGCNTSIWGAQPKKCFMCGYDFEHPDPSQTLEARAQAELNQGQALAAVMEAQKEIEKSATIRIEEMAKEFLRQEWPETNDGTSLGWSDAFIEAARQAWPEATFFNIRAEAWLDINQCWVKRIKGEMDLIQQRVVGFRFEYRLTRQSDQHL